MLERRQDQRPLASRAASSAKERKLAKNTSPSQHGRVGPRQGGLSIYDRHKTVVEPVNRLIKEARGLRQLLLRGQEKVKGD